MQLHRGRLFDHVQLVVNDLAETRRFYGAVLETLGIPIQYETAQYFQVDELFVTADGPKTGRAHLAFQARNREAVEAFYKAGLAGGGRDNGAPGERAYHPGYYAAFLLDPDGNNIEAVYHGPADYSADSVVITVPE